MTKRNQIAIWVIGCTIALALLLRITASILLFSQKDEIIAYATAAISEKMNGEISIKNFGLTFFSTFPYPGIRLEEVVVHDSLYHVHEQHFFKTGKIIVQLNLMALLYAEIEFDKIILEDALIQVFHDSTGYSNSYMLAKQENKSSEEKKTHIPVNHIVLKNVIISISNDLKNKLVEFHFGNTQINFDEQDSTMSIDLILDATIKSLAFNTIKGSFAENATLNGRINLNIDPEHGILEFESGKLLINKQLMDISGKFLLGEEQRFSMNIKTERILYSSALKLLNHHITKSLRKFEISTPVKADFKVSGSLLAGEEPDIKVSWQVVNAEVTTAFAKLNQCSFSGIFLNSFDTLLPREDENSIILLTGFNGKWFDVPIQSDTISIRNLKEPQILTHIKSEFDLRVVNKLIGKNTFSIESGIFSLDANYSGQFFMDKRLESTVDGDIHFKDANLSYIPRSIKLNDCSGIISLKGHDMFLQDFKCKIGKDWIFMNGFAHNMLDLINKAPEDVVFDWDVKAKRVDLDYYIGLLSDKRQLAKKETKSTAALQKTSKTIDEMLEKCKVNIHFKSDKVVFKKFEATNTEARLSLAHNRWELKKVYLNHADGNLTLYGSVIDESPNINRVNLNGKMNDVRIEKVFYAFEDFGQDAVTQNNIKGRLTSKFSLSAKMNDKAVIDPKSIFGDVSISLKDGELNDFEPIMKLSGFLFKKRDFAHVQFAELKDTLNIRGKEILINKLEIQSTLVSMFIEGVYSYDGTADMMIQLPLSNLKKRDKNYKPENIGAQDAGTSVFVRATQDEKGRVRFKYDHIGKIKPEKEGKKGGISPTNKSESLIDH